METMDEHTIPPDLLKEICKYDEFRFKIVIDAADRKTAVVGPEKGQYRTLD